MDDGAAIPDPAWLTAWMASGKNPLLFATDVLGFLLPGVPNPDDKPQLEQWQFEFLRDFHVGPDGKPTDDPRHSVRAGHGVGSGSWRILVCFSSTTRVSICRLRTHSTSAYSWRKIRT